MFSLSDSISQLSVGDLSFIGRNMVGVTKTQEKMRETQNGIANGSRRRTRSHLVNADVGRVGARRRPDAAVRDPYHSRYEISPNRAAHGGERQDHGEPRGLRLPSARRNHAGLEGDGCAEGHGGSVPL